ncbi:MAG: PDZ domain-containing protein [bacterium]|nr:PDZ domain-containing protein [bacterium]
MSINKMKSVLPLILVAAVLISLAIPQLTSAQMEVKTMSGGDLFIIPGLGAVVAPQEGKLKIIVVPEDRPKEYATVDIESGDFLLMVDGKRVKTNADLKEVFNGIKVGTMLEMGLKRDKAMLIVPMKRAADDDTGGKTMMMTRTVDVGGDEGGIQFEGDVFDVVVIPEVGITLADEEQGLSVVGLMPAADENLNGERPSQGDIVITLMGRPVTTVEEFDAVYEPIKTSDTVTMEYKHEGESRKLIFTKMEIKQKKVMMEN